MATAVDHGLVVTIQAVEEWDAKLAEAANADKTVVVDFSATWCGPCRAIAPTFAALSKKYPNIVFLKVDVDDVPDVAAACKISAMPTFQVFRNKHKVDELVGASPPKLEELVGKYDKKH
eukprot:SM000068S20596  [mRNA]  locus=s68:434021:434770:+ [translate_table: standard]